MRKYQNAIFVLYKCISKCINFQLDRFCEISYDCCNLVLYFTSTEIAVESMVCLCQSWGLFSINLNSGQLKAGYFTKFALRILV